VWRIRRLRLRIKGVLFALETHETACMGPEYPAGKITPRIAGFTHGDWQRTVGAADCAFVKPT